MDRWRRDGHRSSRYFQCTPILEAKRRKILKHIDMDIETRMPAAVEELRRWTSDEALGDITVPPDCVTRITANSTITTANGGTNEDQIDTAGGATSGDEGIDHKLPSPEEQIIAIANKFPAEIVAVNVSQKRFNRMCAQRRSLLHVEASTNRHTGDPGTSTQQNGTTESTQNTSSTHRSRTRKPRAKRRNTIAGTDQKEIQEAICGSGAHEGTSTDTNTLEKATTSSTLKEKIKTVTRSKSSDLLRSTKKEASLSPTEVTSGTQTIKKSHFNSLKQWGKNRLKAINKSFESKISSGNHNGSANSSSDNSTFKIEDIDDVNIYETVTTVRRRKEATESTTNETKQENQTNLPISTPGAVMSMAVKLRESSIQRRRRNNKGSEDQQLHSSSGNWSASSESGRTSSIGSEITTTSSTTTHQPKSISSSCTPSSITSRRKYNLTNLNTNSNTSSTSEGTLTPDIIHDLHQNAECDEDGSSSVYSCDTEGYYTSFHVDSGLKTLKEEDLNTPSAALHITNCLHDLEEERRDHILSAESEYELFGKGSTSTTTSSAGTVCTTLMANNTRTDSQHSLLYSNTINNSGPTVPERKSSLEPQSTGTIKRKITKAQIHGGGDESPDSGHNTSSSPIESIINSPNENQHSYSEYEYSESSDLEGVERIERIRLKTTINSSRIPSMCVITPSQSDDEDTTDNKVSSPIETDIDADLNLDKNHRIVVQPIYGTKKIQILNINQQSGYATVHTYDKHDDKSVTSSGGGAIQQQPPQILKSTLQPLNTMFGKLRTNISNLTHKNSQKDRESTAATSLKTQQMNQQQQFEDDGAGEYVTIADIRNNNKTASGMVGTSTGTSGLLINNNNNKDKITANASEYVSLNELPTRLDCPEMNIDSLERKRRQGARVTLDADGQVVYSSDSLRRRHRHPNINAQHSTFEPGPFVKDTIQTTPSATASPLLAHRTAKIIRPISSAKDNDNNNEKPQQLGKIVIRATSKSTYGGATPPPTADFIRMPPTTIVSPTSTSPNHTRGVGAYVNVLDTPPSPGHEEEGPAHFKYNIDVIKSSPYIDQPTMAAQSQQLINRYSGLDRNSSIYRTLPTRKPPTYYEEAPTIERCVTPDITRGLEQSSNNPSPKSKIPMGISNFFSPIKDKSPKISPIDPRNTGEDVGFKSSTPTSKVAINLTSKLVPPKKSTMSYDELYAVIHKSKKKFGITSSPEGNQAQQAPPPRDRHSWSPNYKDSTQISTKLESASTKPVQKTSTMDFKRLLLQHGAKSTKLSAVEQLKLSKPSPQSPLNILDLSSSPKSLTNRKLPTSPSGSPRHQSSSSEKQRVVPRVLLSPRSAWRFASPRSDVLSSTILEDCREDENSSNSLEKDKTTLNIIEDESDQSSIIESASKLENNNITSGVRVPPSRRQIPVLSTNKSKDGVLSGMSRAQYLQAQREQFFLSGQTAQVVQISTPQQNNTISSTKCPSPPTLETAL
ncbi:serine-rich adhesin for platelets-like [Chrysoperla carnea]|uniref:serine-rich adhesin for platelets-like n=1 Tax=Chrysoperla carnea TaxID=189513 RepID=UPI001D089CE1|nr:serine-rich adhesin for platelets-like [Chrysoperla carnea]